jgi:protein-L-isoaspartate(D-aspartate) O-methyltransferase
MDFTRARTSLVEQLSIRIKDRRVLAAMARVPREQFIPAESYAFAYNDRPLPIGLNQTISQPYIIALMTEALGLTGVEKVLEIGTGSGYQTAILAELARCVITVERLSSLAASAGRVLAGLGYTNTELYPAGETLGKSELAPYDAIIVTAAAPEIPEDLMSQLSIGGRLVIPVGSRYVQELLKVIKGVEKNTVIQLGACQFVPLIGRGAWEKEP